MPLRGGGALDSRDGGIGIGKDGRGGSVAPGRRAAPVANLDIGRTGGLNPELHLAVGAVAHHRARLEKGLSVGVCPGAGGSVLLGLRRDDARSNDEADEKQCEAQTTRHG
ncbi:MAG: hypothetical protein BRD26_07750 [Bacteroidetes bacterium QH_1_64_81]|nr:MAG: hypothetical protein BRD26_07750 [Bacteroidetes bacterium QH_1_64_81]